MRLSTPYRTRVIMVQPHNTLGGIRMGVLCDYFAAPTDTVAASVVDLDGGPAAHAIPLPTIQVKGIDPVVQMGTLEAILTGQSHDDIWTEHVVPILADHDGGERLVVRLRDELVTALAQAKPKELKRTSVAWSKTEEFWGRAGPKDLLRLLASLAELARGALARSATLYCWVCV
jgi:hypothetical protein